MNKKRRLRDVLSAILLVVTMIFGAQIGSMDIYAAYSDGGNTGGSAFEDQAEIPDDYVAEEVNSELSDTEPEAIENSDGQNLIPPAQSLDENELMETEIRVGETPAQIGENETLPEETDLSTEEPSIYEEAGSSVHEDTGEFEGTVVGANPEEPVGASDASTVDVRLKVNYDQNSAREMLALVNDFRTGDEAWAYDKNNVKDYDSYAGLGTLQYDYDLEQLAMQRAADCVLFYGHDLPDKSSRESRVYNGVQYQGENISSVYSKNSDYTAATAVTNFKETDYPYSGQSHRRNMLYKYYDRFAASHVYVIYDTGNASFGTMRKDFWVQLFGMKGSARNAVVVTSAVNGEQTRTVTISTDYITGQKIEVESSGTMTAGNVKALPSTRQLIKTTKTYPDAFKGKITKYENGSVVGVEEVSLDNYVEIENDLTWTSSNAALVKVQNGKMYALKAGTATLTVKNEICSATTTIKVSAKPTNTPTPKLTTTVTPTPTKKPTSTLTPTPTKKPTNTPTPTPTKKPTNTPTPTPTKKPTATPTSIPATSISNANFSGISLSYGYTGKARTPAFSVIVDGKTLTAGTDYTYKFTNNVNPGTATLTVTGIGKYTGTRVKKFEIVDCVSTLVSGRTYQLIPKNNSSTAVCSFSGRVVKNTKVYITDRSSSEAMKFRAEKNSDGTWKFINEKCELALAVQQNSSALGAGIVLYDQTTRPAQNWKLSRKSDNSFAIINAVTGYSIAMSDASAVKGTTLSMAKTASNGLQRFYIAETSGVDNRYNGTYYVKSAMNQKYTLNVASSSKTDGANVNLYWKNNDNARKFTALYSGGGYYRFVNVNSNLVLTVAGNTKTNGANVIQSAWAAKSGQRWKIIENSDGSVTLKSALGTTLKLNSSTAKNSANVVSATSGSAKQLRWYLE